MALFGLLKADPELFKVRDGVADSYARSEKLLQTYADQAFSYVDAIVLLTADDDSHVDRILTVDSTLAAYRFAHSVAVTVPEE